MRYFKLITIGVVWVVMLMEATFLFSTLSYARRIRAIEEEGNTGTHFKSSTETIKKLEQKKPSDNNVSKTREFSEEVLAKAKKIGVSSKLETLISRWVKKYENIFHASPDIITNFVKALGYTASTRKSMDLLAKLCSNTNTLSIQRVIMEALIDIGNRGINIKDNKLYFLEPQKIKDLDDSFTKFCNGVFQSTASSKLRILDLGARDGSFERNTRGYSWGIDVDIVSIDINGINIRRAFYTNLVNVRKMSWESLDFDKDSFDIVTLNYPNPEVGIGSFKKAVKEAYRVARERGGIAITSVETKRNGFLKSEVIKVLKDVGFTSIQVYKGKEIPSSYPETKASAQLKSKFKYLILARK